MDTIYLNLRESREYLSRLAADLYRVSGAVNPALGDAKANADRLENLICDLGRYADEAQYAIISALDTSVSSTNTYTATVDASTMMRELAQAVSDFSRESSRRFTKSSMDALKDLAVFTLDQKVILHLEVLSGTDQSRLWNYQIGI